MIIVSRTINQFMIMNKQPVACSILRHFKLYAKTCIHILLVIYISIALAIEIILCALLFNHNLWLIGWVVASLLFALALLSFTYSLSRSQKFRRSVYPLIYLITGIALAMALGGQWLWAEMVIIFAGANLLLFTPALHLKQLASKLPKSLSLTTLIHYFVYQSHRSIQPESHKKQYHYWSNGQSQGLPPGTRAPNGIVYNQNHQKRLLSDHLAKRSATVIIFGSASNPFLIDHMDDMRLFIQRCHQRNLKVVFVYIAETRLATRFQKQLKRAASENDHNNAVNETNDPIAANESLTKRKLQANMLQLQYGLKIPICIDSMNNTLLKLYNAWPARLYIIKNNQITYCSAQGDLGLALNII